MKVKRTLTETEIIELVREKYALSDEFKVVAKHSKITVGYGMAETEKCVFEVYFEREEI